ncbi:MAG: peptide ABC transporter ATP-binding protein [Planctomycetaceae bacterium]|nr:peptide ABC transporter ATP-binding protein [Planctomycetaceae bacterium]|tara:strand:- start:175 stop:1179 length:1005 start_codon:yes stop_codon:yes gene_type:complete
MPSSDQPILEVKDLEVEFHTDSGVVQAVNRVSFDLYPGETLGIVGESGSGKSVTNLTMLGLTPQPPGKVVGGSVKYDGQELLSLSQKQWQNVRGKKIAMIFQDPMTALNPFLTVEEQLVEVTMLHMGLSRAEASKHAIELLQKVGIPGAEKRIGDYPHQFSGGMRQRVMIAMAISCQPDILIADEPTTALDVTIQAQILELMKTMQQEFGTAIIFITHDLGVVASICDRVMVMYAGRKVELSTTVNIFKHPRHPYTMGLLSSAPRWDQGEDELQAIDGQPPDLLNLPTGCSFNPRCQFVQDECLQQTPPLITLDEQPVHQHACIREIRYLKENR